MWSRCRMTSTNLLIGLNSCWLSWCPLMSNQEWVPGLGIPSTTRVSRKRSHIFNIDGNLHMHSNLLWNLWSIDIWTQLLSIGSCANDCLCHMWSGFLGSRDQVQMQGKGEKGGGVPKVWNMKWHSCGIITPQNLSNSNSILNFEN